MRFIATGWFFFCFISHSRQLRLYPGGDRPFANLRWTLRTAFMYAKVNGSSETLTNTVKGDYTCRTHLLPTELVDWILRWTHSQTWQYSCWGGWHSAYNKERAVIDWSSTSLSKQCILLFSTIRSTLEVLLLNHFTVRTFHNRNIGMHSVKPPCIGEERELLPYEG